MIKTIFTLLVAINALAFTADCITYEYGENPLHY